MTRLTIICHAPTAATRAARFPDDEVVETAPDTLRRQVSHIAARRWLTGPERRTRGTAAAVSGDASVVIDDDLRDWDVGRWRGRDLSELQQSEPAALLAWLTDASAMPHGGESLRDLLIRAGSWLDRQAATRNRLAAVTHPQVLRALVTTAIDAGEAAFRHIDVQPLCRVQLSHDGRRWVLQSLLSPGNGLASSDKG